MAVLGSILAWRAETRGRVCLVLDTDNGCVVRMTLPDWSILEQRCTSLSEGVRIADQWRDTCGDPSADPQAA